MNENSDQQTTGQASDTSPDVSVGTPPPSPQFGDLKSDDKTMGMLCHLLGIFTGFLGALIIWLIKKDQSAFVNDQGKEALNFQITVFLAFVVASLTCFIGIGLILVPAVYVLNIVFCIIAAIAANGGKAYRYPLAIRLIK